MCEPESTNRSLIIRQWCTPKQRVYQYFSNNMWLRDVSTLVESIKAKKICRIFGRHVQNPKSTYELPKIRQWCIPKPQVNQKFSNKWCQTVRVHVGVRIIIIHLNVSESVELYAHVEKSFILDRYVMFSFVWSLLYLGLLLFFIHTLLHVHFYNVFNFYLIIIIFYLLAVILSVRFILTTHESVY